MFEGEGYDQTMMRRHHSLLLFNLIRDAQQISRVDLSKITQMSSTSIGKIVKDLIDRGLVIETGQSSGKVGRKPTLLQINPEGAYVIGVDVDLERLALGVVDLNGKIVSKLEKPINLKQNPEFVVDDIVQSINELSDQFHAEAKNIIGVGICIPGLVSWPDGNIAMIPQFQWKDIKLRELLESKLNHTVYVDNNVKTGLLAEYLFGSVKGMKHIVSIHIGSGLGSAVIENGDILRGVSNALGEIGHTIMDPKGQLCDCGRFGCLQTFICSTALEKQAGKSIADIIAAANNQDPTALKLLERAGEYLAIAVSNVISMYNPESILLVGSMMEHYPELFQIVKRYLAQYSWEPLNQSCDLRLAKFGSESGIIGGTALVLNEKLKLPLKKNNALEEHNLTTLEF
ncbi:ROK family transcriptional regulator [Paenibacillus sanguinis]|uniref:ROK family transcriptional regulator n=1 Tax=Paenibacillus sanguinis TaxID=225906 RepID=UPI000363312D|nr:ROK family transcriptional regulator [Paenibacillus sanguinis]